MRPETLAARLGIRWRAGNRARITDDGTAHGLRHYLRVGSIGTILEDTFPGDFSVYVEGHYDNPSRGSRWAHQYVPLASLHVLECDSPR